MTPGVVPVAMPAALVMTVCPPLLTGAVPELVACTTGTGAEVVTPACTQHRQTHRYGPGLRGVHVLD